MKTRLDAQRCAWQLSPLPSPTPAGPCGRFFPEKDVLLELVDDFLAKRGKFAIDGCAPGAPRNTRAMESGRERS